MTEENVASSQTMRRGRKRSLMLFGFLATIFYGIWVTYNGVVHSEKNNTLPTEAAIDDKPQVLENPDKAVPTIARKIDVKEPINRVFLVYIPSTQADSIQNILLRKAIQKDLNVALPQTKRDSMCFPKTFEQTCPHNSNEAPFDMMVHQIRYERHLPGRVVKPNFKLIVVIRHPIAHLQAIYYDNDWSDFVNDNSFNYFIKYQYRQFARIFDFDSNLPYRNIQLFSLGYPAAHNDNREAVRHKVEDIIHDFHLVIIQEYMLESLVLLKEQLNWQLEDMTTFSLHARPEYYGYEELDERVNKTVVLHNEGEMKMYEMLLEDFKQKIEEFGQERMNAEKEALQKAINKDTEHCLKKSEEEMKESCRRIDYRLSWEGETDRLCHYHVSRGSELTTLLRINWDKKDAERKRKSLHKKIDAQKSDD
ncbi:galactosylceramide sulfotransferase-like [Watersipora subatra]|uniref:galactosylceramide sulfotransferase-like n=1 Tax=Watersipora subatra TaxID=2589382 RepID=UPI00355B8CBF